MFVINLKLSFVFTTNWFSYSHFRVQTALP